MLILGDPVWNDTQKVKQLHQSKYCLTNKFCDLLGIVYIELSHERRTTDAVNTVGFWER